MILHTTIDAYQSVFRVLTEAKGHDDFEALKARVMRLSDTIPVLFLFYDTYLKSIHNFQKIQNNRNLRSDKWVEQFHEALSVLHRSQGALAALITTAEAEATDELAILKLRLEATAELILKATEEGFLHFPQPHYLTAGSLINQLRGGSDAKGAPPADSFLSRVNGIPKQTRGKKCPINVIKSTAEKKPTNIAKGPKSSKTDSGKTKLPKGKPLRKSGH